MPKTKVLNLTVELEPKDPHYRTRIADALNYAATMIRDGVDSTCVVKSDGIHLDFELDTVSEEEDQTRLVNFFSPIFPVANNPEELRKHLARIAPWRPTSIAISVGTLPSVKDQEDATVRV